MFEFEGICMRPIEEPDLEKMVRLRGIPQIWMNLGTVEMIGMREQKQWFDRLFTNPRARYFVLCTNDIDFVGIVRMDEIDFINRSMRIGGDILPEYQGKGYGKRMFQLLKKYCFDYLNMHRIWLLVLKTNDVALSLYRSAGFIEEGFQRQAIYRDGNYVDYIMMSLLKSEYFSQLAKVLPSVGDKANA
jgi:UDP-4-amino-4,6-dideoxy-N-acetyl-beta-L-altrosamine N-acetyltransferase